MELTEHSYPIVWQKSVVRNFCEVPLDKPSPYTSIELQRAENNGHTGFIVLLNHGNRELDILYEEQLGLDEQWALTEPATSHLTVRNLEVVQFSSVHCFVSASEIDAQAEFYDLEKRKIELLVKHRFSRGSAPICAPAPKQEAPTCLRFLALDVFHLLPSYAKVDVKLDGVALPASSFVLPRGLSPFSSTRVGGNFLLAGLAISNTASAHGAQTSAVNTVNITDQELWMKVVGLPPMEDLMSLQLGDTLSGKFSVDSSIGALATGKYQCRVDENGLDFNLDSIVQDWRPGWRSPARGIMKYIRRYNRREERWAVNVLGSIDKNSHEGFVGKWTNE